MHLSRPFNKPVSAALEWVLSDCWSLESTGIWLPLPYSGITCVAYKFDPLSRLPFWLAAEIPARVAPLLLRHRLHLTHTDRTSQTYCLTYVGTVGMLTYSH